MNSNKKIISDNIVPPSKNNMNNLNNSLSLEKGEISEYMNYFDNLSKKYINHNNTENKIKDLNLIKSYFILFIKYILKNIKNNIPYDKLLRNNKLIHIFYGKLVTKINYYFKGNPGNSITILSKIIKNYEDIITIKNKKKIISFSKPNEIIEYNKIEPLPPTNQNKEIDKLHALRNEAYDLYRDIKHIKKIIEQLRHNKENNSKIEYYSKMVNEKIKKRIYYLNLLNEINADINE